MSTNNLFHYYNHFSIESINPKYLNKVGDETKNVTGKRFQNNILYACHFGDNFYSFFTCASTTSMSRKNLSTKDVGLLKELESIYLKVSSNQRDFTHVIKKLKFQSIATFSLTFLSPKFLLAYGATSIIVHGTGFQNISSALCWFGIKAMIGNFIWSTLISFFSSPAYLEKDTLISTASFTITHSAGKTSSCPSMK